MAGFSSFTDLLAEMAAGKVWEVPFQKAGSVSVTNQWYSHWKQAGFPPAGGDPATTPGTQYSNADGSIYFDDKDPDRKFLVKAGLVSQSASYASVVMVYDRLVGVSGISLTSTGDKTINSAALPRYTDGVGVLAALEITTATNTTAPVVTLNSYTNTGDQAGRAGDQVTLGSTYCPVGYFHILPLQAGDKGVKAVATINVGTATTGGIANLILFKPLAVIPLVPGISNDIEFVMQQAALPRIYDDACLGFLSFYTSTVAVGIGGCLTVAHG